MPPLNIHTHVVSTNLHMLCHFKYSVHVHFYSNLDYRLLFADQGKQTSVFRFPYAENKWKFAVTVFLLQ